MGRIFYFNINYGCDNNCVFCYSHNTQHRGMSNHEISLNVFQRYLKENNITEKDRIILNGGEPLLHTNINEILYYLRKINCEVLVYSNGTHLVNIDFSTLSPKFRFIIPIHGDDILHDSITRNYGSWIKTINGMQTCIDKGTCFLDLKVILNESMFRNKENWYKVCSTLLNVPFNNAVHLTKMADTIISKKNQCNHITQEEAKHYTKLLFELFISKNCKIKLYDTCVLGLKNYFMNSIFKQLKAPKVFFKDYNQFRKINIEDITGCCSKKCDCRFFCMSAVKQYKVLEYFDGKFYQNLE